MKKTVGIVGTTGSGKTTTVDIILGLLEPQKGSLIVDDLAITDTNCGSWQRLIGYVPQHIYLTDDTIAANIAFGVNSKEINQELVDNVRAPKAMIMTINAGFISDDHWVQDLEIGGGRIIGEACHIIDLMSL